MYGGLSVAPFFVPVRNDGGSGRTATTCNHKNCQMAVSGRAKQFAVVRQIWFSFYTGLLLTLMPRKPAGQNLLYDTCDASYLPTYVNASQTGPFSFAEMDQYISRLRQCVTKITVHGWCDWYPYVRWHRQKTLRHSDLLTTQRTSLKVRGVVNLRNFKRFSELILVLKE